MFSIKYFTKILLVSVICTACGDDLPKKKSTPDGGNKPPVTGSQDAKKVTPPVPTAKLTGPLPLFKLEEGIPSESKKFLVKLDWLKGPAVKNDDVLRLTFAKLDLQKPGKVVVTKIAFLTCCSEVFIYNAVTSSENFNVYIVSNINFKAVDYGLRVEATVDGVADSISKELGTIK